MRIAAFVAVGAIGFLLQMAALAGLLAAGWPYLPATANFLSADRFVFVRAAGMR